MIFPEMVLYDLRYGVRMLAGMLSGLAPAMESSRSALSSAARGSTASIRRRRLQDILVAAQVALSLVLMIAGSMAIRSSIHSLAMDTGYDSKHVFELEFRFPENSRYDAVRKHAVAQELRTRLAALAEVAVVASGRPPGELLFRTAAVSANEDKSSAQNLQAMLSYGCVEGNYFEALGIPLISGRSFQLQTGEPDHSVIVSESAARQLWPGQNPVGRRLRLGLTDERFHNEDELFATGPAREVIGVVRDIRGAGFDASDSRRVYLPLTADRLQSYPILVRTRSDPAQIMRAVDLLVSSIDPNVMTSVSTLEDMLRESAPFIVSVLAAVVACTVGMFGLLLALMGIYGTISYIVVLRTREVSIRVAIGAQKRDIIGLILLDSARPVFAGLFAGMLMGIGISYAARGLLYGLSGVDGISVTGASLLFLVIALVASCPPARRALRVDPMVALRCE